MKSLLGIMLFLSPVNLAMECSSFARHFSFDIATGSCEEEQKEKSPSSSLPNPLTVQEQYEALKKLVDFQRDMLDVRDEKEKLEEKVGEGAQQAPLTGGSRYRIEALNKLYNKETIFSSLDIKCQDEIIILYHSLVQTYSHDKSIYEMYLQELSRNYHYALQCINKKNYNQALGFMRCALSNISDALVCSLTKDETKKTLDKLDTFQTVEEIKNQLAALNRAYIQSLASPTTHA